MHKPAHGEHAAQAQAQTLALAVAVGAMLFERDPASRGLGMQLAEIYPGYAV